MIQKLTVPFQFERDYLFWLQSYNREIINNVVNSSLKDLGMDLIELRNLILKSEHSGNLFANSMKQIRKERDECSDLDFFNKYISSWYQHDNSLFQLAQNWDVILSSEDNWETYLKQFIFNDCRLRVYVSEGLEPRIEKIRKELLDTAEKIVIPPISSFEIQLVNYVYQVRNGNKNITEFANEFTYSNIDLAHLELNTFELDYDFSLLERVQANQNKKVERYQTLIENIANKHPELEESIRLLHRMSHWGGYEEPQKRYKVEFGVLDVLFRESIFLKLKAKSNNHLVNNANYALDIKQDLLLDLTKEDGR